MPNGHVHQYRHCTFNQYHVVQLTMPHVGKSSLSTNVRNFSRLVTHKPTTAPSLCANSFKGRERRYLSGSVGYLIQNFNWFKSIVDYKFSKIIKFQYSQPMSMYTLILPGWIYQYEIVAIFFLTYESSIF